MPAKEKFPVVMRMAGIRPENLRGYEVHRQRRGGDLGHVDPDRTPLNRPLLGTKNWASLALAEIEEMRVENFANELDGLKRRRRKKELERRLAEGPRDPWAPSRHGPMREVILTANREWFEAVGPAGEQQFEAQAVAWLKASFGDDCVHARADLDEEVYHVHAVILPRAVAKDGRRVLQPSKHEMIRSYEVAQDSVGAWFADLGLARGEERAEAIRIAKRHNAAIQKQAEEGVPADQLPQMVEVPPRREHVSPRHWREKQEVRLADREVAVMAREGEVAVQTEQLAGREGELAEKERDAARRDTQLKAREDAAVAHEDELRTKEATFDKRRAGVESREKEADTKYHTAEAMISVARKVAAGDIDVAEKTDPADRTSSDPVVLARHQAATLFGRALRALRLKARDGARADAEEKARQDLSAAFAEIKAADEVIVGIARLLPAALRDKIGQARGSLRGSIAALNQMAKRQFRNRDHERPEK